MKPTNNIMAVLSVAALVGVLTVPGTVFAAYSFQGRTFSTYEEYTSFVAEYLRVWRELTGESNKGTTVTPRTIQRTNESGTSGADTGTSGADYTSGSGADEDADTGGVSTRTSGSVQTSLARDIAADNAWLTGTFDIRRGTYATVWFEYGFSSARLDRVSEYEVLRSYGGDTRYDQRVRGLIPQTKYYYRAVAKTADGNTHYGAVRSFTTGIDYDSKEALVVVTTDRVYDIDDNRATFGARVRFIKSSYATVWFLYGEDKDDLHRYTGPVRVLPTGNRYAEYVRDDLKPETTYYVRAVAQDDKGVYSYGDIRWFTTKRDIVNERPVVTVKQPTDVTAYSATFAADIDMNDGESGTPFLVYGEDLSALQRIPTAYKRYASIREEGDDLQKVLLDTGLWEFAHYSYTVRDFEPNTRYYYAFGVEYDNEFGDRLLTVSTPRSIGTKRP